MGNTISSWKLSSAAISQAYAHVVEMHRDEESGSVNRALVTFMPDPVCAALAMGLMQENWILKKEKNSDEEEEDDDEKRTDDDDDDNDDDDETLTGETKQFWSHKAMELLKQGICYPEKGEFSEIMGALYMLFCGDVLRYEIDPSLRTFSVPLTDWYTQMRENNNVKEGKPKAEERSGDQLCMEINFIQICRNSFRANSWRTQKALEYMYKSATASYLHLDCEEMDVVASIRVMREGKPFYHPLLVKVTYCMHLSEARAGESMKDLRNLLKQVRHQKAEIQNKGSPDPFSECPPALCIMLLLGVEAQPNEPPRKPNQFESDELGSFPEADTFRVLSVPTDDPFGISSAVGLLASSQDKSKMFVSHSFGYCGEAYNDKTSASQALRGRSQLNNAATFVEELVDEFSN
jgi:hypothetical protein